MRRLLPLLWLAGAPASWAAEGTVAHYMVNEPGLPAYHARLLVTPDYLRLDEGQDTGDFTLLDRRDGALYNVSRDDQTLLVIKPTPVDDASPIPLDLAEEEVALGPDAPRLGDAPLKHYRLSANGTTCWRITVAADLLPELVAAKRQLLTTLAGEQARGLKELPADLQQPCDLANHIYAPTRHLAHGLPIHSFDERGREERLVDYQLKAPLADTLFTLPEGYQRFAPGDLAPIRNPTE